MSGPVKFQKLVQVLFHKAAIFLFSEAVMERVKKRIWLLPVLASESFIVCYFRCFKPAWDTLKVQNVTLADLVFSSEFGVVCLFLFLFSLSGFCVGNTLKSNMMFVLVSLVVTFALAFFIKV